MKSKMFTFKNLIIVALIVILTCIVSFLINISANKKISDNRFDWDSVYSEVIEKNAIMLENPVEYGDKFCSVYVSTSKDKDIHIKVLDNIQKLSDEICADSVTDYDKVRCIAYWVAENLHYNFVAAENEVNSEIISLEYVYETRTATCAGYSNMFSALCNMQGIYCVNLRGGTYSRTVSAENLISAPINHEWNAVMIDDEWIFVDTTWMSENEFTEDGYIKSEILNEEYFDTPFNEMCYEHRIDIIDYRNFKNSIRVFD